MKTMKPDSHMHHHPYLSLLGMVVLSYISMYILMYAMVDRFNNVVNNINQVYMAGLMTAPMILIELMLMKHMYRDKKRNILIILAGVALLIICFASIRMQAGVKDKQFLKSMIPHHAGAILMVEEAELTDPQIKELAQQIIESQQKEIEYMKAKLKELDQ